VRRLKPELFLSRGILKCLQTPAIVLAFPYLPRHTSKINFCGREAADQEDAIEKLPVTPGPILPARELLGYLLLEQNHAARAMKEFETVLAKAPGRRGSLQGAAHASELVGKN